MSHELLHTHPRYVSVGDPVVAGQLVGSMGNTGVIEPYIESGDHHLHYQLKDPAGRRLKPCGAGSPACLRASERIHCPS
ncbi:hypothetical protein ACRQ5Q_13050 [Bradyrhizobium sp. PMVTL-01]|uniref:hypothetical protein n=1 Tax=unclassified Bradyrhizobium TaxID=2631580 RepID=UPI003F6EF09F